MSIIKNPTLTNNYISKTKSSLSVPLKNPLPKAPAILGNVFSITSLKTTAGGGGGWCLPDLFSALCKFFSDQFIEAIKKTPLPSQAGIPKGLQSDTTNSLASLTKHFDITTLSNCWLTSYTLKVNRQTWPRVSSYFMYSFWMTVQLISVVADYITSTIIKSSWHWVDYQLQGKGQPATTTEMLNTETILHK